MIFFDLQAVLAIFAASTKVYLYSIFEKHQHEYFRLLGTAELQYARSIVPKVVVFFEYSPCFVSIPTLG